MTKIEFYLKVAARFEFGLVQTGIPEWPESEIGLRHIYIYHRTSLYVLFFYKIEQIIFLLKNSVRLNKINKTNI
jgi:hypothetical protein